MKTALLSAFVVLFALTQGVSADTVVQKPPDIGAYWYPVGNAGSYVYGDCFIAPVGDTNVTMLGTWLAPFTGEPLVPAQDTRRPSSQGDVLLGDPQTAVVRFQVWGTTGGGGPDWQQVLASSDPFSSNLAGLNFYSLPVTSGGGPLTPGVKYWFVVTAVGLGDPNWVPYQVGGHTQNSVYNDNCTFWYSNDVDGHVFDGTNNTPEMAFEVILAGPISTEENTWGRIKSTYR